MTRSSGIALGAVLAAFVLGCDLVGSADVDFRQRAIDETARREGLWKALAIHDYDFDYQRTCDCSPTATQAVRINVRGDNVSAVTTTSGGTVTLEPGTSWPTMDSLFLWTNQFLADKGFAIQIEFDTTYHFPQHVLAVDPGRSSTEHVVTGFTVQGGGPAARQ